MVPAKLEVDIFGLYTPGLFDHSELGDLLAVGQPRALIGGWGLQLLCVLPAVLGRGWQACLATRYWQWVGRRSGKPKEMDALLNNPSATTTLCHNTFGWLAGTIGARRTEYWPAQQPSIIYYT